MDRLQTMSVFVAVAEAAGFAPAARRLAMSPPSVTRAVSELEGRLGCRLLHRTTRSVQMTEAGRRYLADCRRILAEIEEADRHAAGLHAAPRGLVSVTASVMFGRVILAPILLDLLDRYPELSLSTLFVDRVVHLLDEGIDVAVRIAELPDSSLTAVRVGAVRRVLCASPDYLAARGRPAAPSDLAGHEIVNFVNMAPGGEWAFPKDGKARAFRPSSRLLYNQADAAIAAALAGRGITRVLSYMIAPQLEEGTLEIVLEDHEPPAVPVHVVHKEATQASARVRAVVDHLVATLRAEAALKPKRQASDGPAGTPP
jgi:DNA-binding transcriptional LysR family regulator